MVLVTHSLVSAGQHAASGVATLTGVARPVATTVVLALAQGQMALGSLPPGTSAGLNTLKSWMEGVGTFVAVAALLAVGIQMMGGHHSGSGRDHSAKLIKVGAGALLVGSATAIAGAILP